MAGRNLTYIPSTNSYLLLNAHACKGYISVVNYPDYRISDGNHKCVR